MSPFQIIWWVAAALVVVACIWWGDRFARLGAVSLAVSYLLTLGVNHWAIGNVSVGIALVDLFYAGFLLALTMMVRRWWVLLAAANQLLIVAAHVTTLLDPEVMARADITTRWIFGVVVLLALAISPVESWLAVSHADGQRAALDQTSGTGQA